MNEDGEPSEEETYVNGNGNQECAGGRHRKQRYSVEVIATFAICTMAVAGGATVGWVAVAKNSQPAITLIGTLVTAALSALVVLAGARNGHSGK